MDDMTIIISVSPTKHGMCFEVENCPSDGLSSKLCDAIKEALEEQMEEDGYEVSYLNYAHK